MLMKGKGYIYALCALASAFAVACRSTKTPVVAREGETVTYSPAATDFCTPEAGY